MLEQAIRDAGSRMLKRIAFLKGVSDSEECLERILFSPSAEEAAYRLKGWISDAGMQVCEDALTNVSGILKASNTSPHTARIHLGSHYDTVINAGAYDGTLGVLLALAVAEAIGSAKIEMKHDLCTHAFCDEEGVRFQSTFLGSAYVSGQFQRDWLSMPDQDGKTLGEWMVDRAENIDEFLNNEPLIRPQDRFLEAHIEQGPVLQSKGCALGVFSRIAAQLRAEVQIKGEAGHAGTTPARLRKDPLPIAAEMVIAVNDICKSDDSIRATVGQFIVKPNASNVIPESISFTIDLRYPHQRGLEQTHRTIFESLKEIAKRSGLSYTYRVAHEAPDVGCDDALSELLGKWCKKYQGISVDLFSGAGHDSMKIAQVCPVGILAVRCRDGLSHHPDEFASDEDCIVALRTIVDTVLELDRTL